MNGLISNFYSQQRSLEYNGMIQGSALVGFALEANYDSFVISTSTSLQNTAGYLTRGSFLLAMGEPERAVLLRVQEVASSPLRSLETMTTYELSKRSMPELDRHTKTEMSWYCVRCDVLGTYYEYGSQVLFSGDMDRLLAPTDYRVFTAYNLLELVVNGVYYADKAGIYRALEYAGLQSWGFVSFDGFCSIGTFRPTELFDGNSCHMVNLYLSDIAGRRTALFGKTRSGKSNTVKMIAAALIRQNISAQNLGQLIIDTNGEYANDNPQDGLCLYSRFPGECVVYAVNVKPGSSAHILRCNFYRMPGQAMAIFQEKLREKPGLATYVSAFLAVPVESLEVCGALLPGGERTRAIRRIQMLWAALYAAGFPANEAALASSAPSLSARQSPFDPGLSTGLREAIHGQPVPSAPTSLHELFAELEALNRFRKQHPDSRQRESSAGTG